LRSAIATIMSERCENCGNPVLATDTICWHCGWKLPKRPRLKTSSPAPPPTARSRQAREARESAGSDTLAVDRYDLRAIIVYGALTAVILVALLVVMRSLGRQPLLVAGADLRLGDDWTAVTDNNLRYVLSLPSGWQWLDGAYREQQGLLDELAASVPNIRWSLAPLGEVAGDLELLAVAYQPEPPEVGGPFVFVAIGRSQRLGQIAPQQALELLAERSLPLAATDLIENIPGQPQARFALLDNSRQVQCRTLFMPNDDESVGYLVTACAPQESFGRVQRDLDRILDSFQLFQRP
jgi:hypothetical protein